VAAGTPVREARTGTVALPGGAGHLDAQREAAAQRHVAMYAELTR